jgi:CelD/BcsL family acetyltransferase involved in cellulose biosynthesis
LFIKVNYSIELIESLEKLKTIKDDWNRLFNLKEQCPIFFSFDIFYIYYETISNYYKDVKIKILVVRNENRKIVAILPFTIEKKVNLPYIKIKELSTKDSFLIGFYIFLIDTRDMPKFIFQRVVKYLKINKNCWDIIKFYYIPNNEVLYKDFKSVIIKNYNIHEEKIQTLIINCNREFTDFINRDIEGKNRRELKRKIRRLNEKGEIKLIEFFEKNDVELGLKKFYNIEDKNWKGREGTSLKKSYYGDFFKKTALYLAEKKKFRIFFLQLNGEYIAGILSIIDNKTCYLIKIGYDEDFFRYSPSNILFYLLFEFLFNEKIIEKIDFYGPYYKYQKIFGTNTREKYNLIICNKKFVSTIYFILSIALKKLSSRYPANSLFLKLKGNKVTANLINRLYR